MPRHKFLQGLALGRAAIGATALASPRRAAEPWIGKPARDERVQVIVRATGARDLVLATGTLAALRSPAGARAWLMACGVADGIDFAATLAARRRLPHPGGIAVLGLAGGAAAIHLLAAVATDRR